MVGSIRRSTTRSRLVSGLGLLALFATTGCQVDIGGQTLPSPYYMSDDIQYFPPGHEFKLANEAAAMAADRADAQRRGEGVAPATQP